MNTVLRVCVSLLIPIGLASSLSAEDKKSGQAVPQTSEGQKAPRNAGAVASAEEVGTLIQQLKSGKYAERNDATRKLAALGTPVIKAVGKAALTDDLELGARCVDILKHLHQNGDAATKSAAETALKNLRQSKHKSVSAWAGEALGENRFGFNSVRPFGNRNVIRIRGFGRIGRVLRQAGFQREVKVTENGKKIHITQTMMPGNQQIVIKITEKVNGKEKTTEIKAASVAELRRKNKAAYKLYLKHFGKARLQINGGINVIQLQIPQLPAGGAGGNITVTSRTVNGKRQIDINENGKKMQIHDTNGKDIVVKIEETVNGQQKTVEYKAKDFNELKKKHPNAAKVYERYAKPRINGVGNIRFGNGLPAVQRLQRPQRRVRRGAKRRGAKRRRPPAQQPVPKDK